MQQVARDPICLAAIKPQADKTAFCESFQVWL